MRSYRIAIIKITNLILTYMANAKDLKMGYLEKNRRESGTFQRMFPHIIKRA